MRYNSVELQAICNINMGQSPESSSYNQENDGMPFFQGNADFGDMYPVTRLWCNKPTKIANEGDLLLSVRAPIGALNFATEECCIGRGLAAISPASEKVNIKYIYYALKSKNQELNNKGTGSTFKAINKGSLSEVKVHDIDISEQNDCVEKLDRVSEIIKYRKTQLNELDNLIKSRFVEMFGDPVTNTKGWEVRTVIDECDCMVPGRDKPKSFSGDIPWITIDDLQINGITINSKKELGLTQEEIDEVKRKTVPEGSVLMSCVGNLGISSIAGKELIINQQLHSFQCGDNVNNYFLMHYLGHRTDYMNKHASSTTVLYMNKTICNSIPLMLPPISFQNQFATFVQQVDKLKFGVQKSLDETQELFDSLMKMYFE